MLRREANWGSTWLPEQNQIALGHSDGISDCDVPIGHELQFGIRKPVARRTDTRQLLPPVLSLFLRNTEHAVMVEKARLLTAGFTSKRAAPLRVDSSWLARGVAKRKLDGHGEQRFGVLN